jgi:hypothetical protein
VPKRTDLAAALARSGRTELGLFFAAYVAYDAARWLFGGDVGVARAHAHSILHGERSLGVALEASVQHALSFEPARWLLGNVYLSAQLVVLPGSLIWLYRCSPRIYRRLRDTVVASWLVAVPIFAAFPVAPPRLASVGIADTVSGQAAVALTGPSTMFYNPFAAVPSLHVGFAFAIGIAVAAAVRSRLVKALALLWGPLVTLAVVATGNHYFFDALMGLAVTGASFLAGRSIGADSTRGSKAAPT